MGNSQITKGAIISYFSVFLSIALTFFYTPWMIKQIGVSDYGLYNLIIAFISYFILDFGLATTVQRFVAKYRAEGKEEKVENLLGLTAKVYFFIDCAIFVVLLIVYFFISNIFQGLTPMEIERFKILYAIAAIFSILNFLLKPVTGAMMAYEYFVETKVLDMVWRLGTVGLIVILLLFHCDVYALVFVNGSVAFVVSLMKFYVFRKKSKTHINWHYFDKVELKQLFMFSGWVFLIGLAQRFRLSFTPSILGIFSNSTEISVFSLGMSVEGMVYTLSSALNGLFLPKVSRMVVDHNDTKGITDLMIRVGRIQLFVTSFILFGFIIIGDSFIELWVGNGFSKTYYVIILLTISNFVSLTQQIADDTVYAQNKVRYTASYTFITSTLCLIASVVLSTVWGAVGCAIAICFSLCLNVALLNVFYKRYLQLDINKFFNMCHLKILPILIPLMAFFFVVKSFLIIDSWLSLLFFLLVYSFVFGGVSYILLLNKEEKSYINTFLVKNI